MECKNAEAQGDAVRGGSSSRPSGCVRHLVALTLFGVSFGYVEAAVVVYLRAIYDPIRPHVVPDREPGDLFPLIRTDQLAALGPQHVRRLIAELGREAATLVMVAAVAAAVARTAQQWLAAFAMVFGVWDVFYYVFLKVILDWPPSLLTWDLLFLLPVPWVGPVLAPLLVSIVMIVSGAWVLWRDARGRPIPLRTWHYLGILLGGFVIVIAFCLDFRNLSAGGMPTRFPWGTFAVGMALGAASFLHAGWKTSCTRGGTA